MPRDKPYSCIVCNKRFVNTQTLATHFNEHKRKLYSDQEQDSLQENINILYKDELSPSYSKKTT